MNRSTGRPGEDTDRVVVVALYDKVTLLDVAAPLEVFARANDFGTRYRVLLVSADGKPVQTTAFTGLNADLPLADVPDRIDTLLVPGGVPADFAFSPTTHDVPEEVTPDEVPDALMAVRELVPLAARIASVCTGAFVLARLGLLNGRRATTHWAHCARLARDYPDVMVEPDALFIEDGPFITGAGDQRRYRSCPGHRRGRLWHRPRPPGRAVAGGVLATAWRTGTVQRLERNELSRYACAEKGPRLGRPRSGRQPLHCGHGRARRHERTPPHADLPRRGRHDASPLRGAGETGSGQAAPRHQRGQSGVRRPAGGIRHRRDDEADLPPQHRRVPGHLPHAFRHHWNRAFPPCIRSARPGLSVTATRWSSHFDGRRSRWAPGSGCARPACAPQAGKGGLPDHCRNESPPSGQGRRARTG
jgi:putative intracellular protease/amidase